MLNTDGVAKGTPGIAGWGGVIRDWRGQFICAFTAIFGICTTYRAELMAVSIGLDMAHDLGIQKLEVQIDNEACAHVIKNLDYQGGECYHIIIIVVV